jgi:transaldolase
MSTLRELGTFGQSAWLDYIRRDLISSGELAGLIQKDGVRGLTSNPAIFEKAFAAGGEYASSIAAAALSSGGRDVQRVYEVLAIEDIRMAADAMRPVHESSQGADGYVSLEVSPRLAHDTEGTLAEARRLWREVNRPNLMIKVPGTPSGMPAIRHLVAEGISVNVTLLFARDAYTTAANAYLEGLTAWVKGGGDPRKVASVASFFISRIDTAVDALITSRLADGAEPRTQALQGLFGKVAIANAKLAYATFQERLNDERWLRLAAVGARPQRLLWASTGTKNPAYSDVLYVEELIGPDTVNTMPPATLDAFRDHGRPRPSLTQDVDGAREIIASLERGGVELSQVTDRLLDEGLDLFVESFDQLLGALRSKI